MRKAPIWLRSGAKGFHFSVEVIAIGMASNLLGLVGKGIGGAGLSSALCFLGAGVVGVILIQKIEGASARATSMVIVAATEGAPMSLEDQYQTEAKKGRGRWMGSALGSLECLLLALGVGLFLVERF